MLSYAAECGQTPPQIFFTAHPPRHVSAFQSSAPVPGAAEPAATIVQAHSRRWLTRRHFVQRAIHFFMHEASFRSASAPALDEAQLVDVVRRGARGLSFAPSPRTAKWLIGVGDGSTDVRDVFDKLLRTEEHPFAQLLAGFCSLAMRVSTSRSGHMRGDLQLSSVIVLVEAGFKGASSIVFCVMPSLDQPKHREVVAELLLDEISSRLYDKLIMPAIRAACAVDDMRYQAKISELRALRPHHLGGHSFQLAPAFWLGGDSSETEPIQSPVGGSKLRTPYASTIRALAKLPTLSSAPRKLALLADTMRAIQQSVLDHHNLPSTAADARASQLQLTSDDFICIIMYVLSQAAVPNLCSELKYIDKFTDKEFLCGWRIGELGYCFATYQAAAEGFISLSWTQLEVTSQEDASTAAVEKLATVDAGAEAAEHAVVAAGAAEAADSSVSPTPVAELHSPSGLSVEPSLPATTLEFGSSDPPEPMRDSPRVRERLQRARAAQSGGSAGRRGSTNRDPSRI